MPTRAKGVSANLRQHEEHKKHDAESVQCGGIVLRDLTYPGMLALDFVRPSQAKRDSENTQK